MKELDQYTKAGSATEAHVQAVNLANAAANALQPLVAAAFAGLVGKKVATKEKVLTNQARAAFDFTPYEAERPGIGSVRIGAATIDRDLPVWFRVWVHIFWDDGKRSGAKYAESAFKVGDTKDGILTGIEQQAPGYRTDYTVAGVQAAREALDRADKAKRQAESDLCPFDRYDH